jgi:hypothetical protein
MPEPSPKDIESTKVFLRRRDGLFYGASGIWTESVEMARDFENASRALVVGRSFAVSGIEIVIRGSEGVKFLPITT